MLTIVIANPIQFTMVSAVPLSFASALWATNVENKGESAITTNPQNNKNTNTTVNEVVENSKGEIRQQIPEQAKAIEAIRFSP